MSRHCWNKNGNTNDSHTEETSKQSDDNPCNESMVNIEQDDEEGVVTELKSPEKDPQQGKETNVVLDTEGKAETDQAEDVSSIRGTSTVKEQSERIIESEVKDNSTPDSGGDESAQPNGKDQRDTDDTKLTKLQPDLPCATETQTAHTESSKDGVHCNGHCNEAENKTAASSNITDPDSTTASDSTKTAANDVTTVIEDTTSDNTISNDNTKASDFWESNGENNKKDPTKDCEQLQGISEQDDNGGSVCPPHASVTELRTWGSEQNKMSGILVREKIDRQKPHSNAEKKLQDTSTEQSFSSKNGTKVEDVIKGGERKIHTLEECGDGKTDNQQEHAESNTKDTEKTPLYFSLGRNNNLASAKDKEKTPPYFSLGRNNNLTSARKVIEKDCRKPDTTLKQFVTDFLDRDDTKHVSCPVCHKHSKIFDFCEDCHTYYCGDCFSTCHPKGGQYSNHMVAHGIPVKDFICTTHKEVLQYFCRVCNEKRCPDCCFLSKKCSRHKVSKVSEYLKERQAHLRLKVNSDTSQCSKESDKMMEAVWLQKEKLKMITLVQRERIMQEFASVRDLLCERETSLYNQMNQILVKNLTKLSALKVQCGKMVESSAEISSLLLDVLAEPSSSQALREMNELDSKILQSEKVRKGLTSVDVTKFTVPAFTLSLYKEKSHLLQSTDIETLEVQNLVTVRSHTLYVTEEMLDKPVLASDLLHVRQPIPPSTSFVIGLQIRSLQERREITSLDEVVLNGSTGNHLTPGQKYVLKFDVRVVTQTSYFGEMVDRKTFHILVVTGGKCMDIDDSPKSRLKERWMCKFRYITTNRQPVYVISFEEARNRHVWKGRTTKIFTQGTRR